MIKICVKYVGRKPLPGYIAVTAARGLRSVGLVAINHLINYLQPKPRLFAEIYCSNFPVVYDGVSYVGTEGMGGAVIEDFTSHLPRVELYCADDYKLILTRGYQADIYGQYDVAEYVVDLYKKLRVKRIIVLLAHVGNEKIKCAFSDTRLLPKDMPVYNGQILGYSGLVLGFAVLKGIECIAYLARTKPYDEDPELGDLEGAKILLHELNKVLNINIDPPKIWKPTEPLDYIM